MSTDLRPPLRVGSMFAGIGGIDLGLERTGGFKTSWFAEIDEYANAVLRKHWPDVPNYGDVRNIDGDAERVDVITAGFPCQPVSLAGKGLAQEDPRWLWPEVARVVGLLRPSYVLLENVPGLRKRGLSIVIGDLAALGYDAEWQIVSAASVGAPHLRERFVIVAYPNGNGNGCEGQSQSDGQAIAGSEVQQRNDTDGLCDALADTSRIGRNGSGPEMEGPASGTGQLVGANGASGDVQDADSSSVQSWRLGWGTPQTGSAQWWASEPDVGRVAHGIPSRLDRLACLGNAVVPQVFEEVGYLILENHLGVKERDAA